jgi:predicted glycogen debranching enzyme
MRKTSTQQEGLNESAEWLETDGLGGFAMGTVGGIRTRRYHGLLITASQPGNPAARVMLLNGIEAWVQRSSGVFHLTPQHYGPDVRTQPERAIESFTNDPWPRWVYRLEDGTHIEHELFLRHGSSLMAMTWRLREPRDGVRLIVRPLISGRDYHALHHVNPSFRFDSDVTGEYATWQPYNGLPAVVARTNGSYRHDPKWYRQFHYALESERGFDSLEDLASPGVLEFDCSTKPAIVMVAGEAGGVKRLDAGGTVEDCLRSHAGAERARRGVFQSRLHFAADQYLVGRGSGKSVIAGYPWFADWGRDTFIAMRGLCLATGRLEEAKQILLAWAHAVSQGMLPNRFVDSMAGEEPEFNSVDASLWFVVASYEFMRGADRERFDLAAKDRNKLCSAVLDIVARYAEGTRHGIKLDGRDWLLAAGEKGQQLTWMDARVDGREITPRIGKPVEIQALWLNALWIASQFSDRWKVPLFRGRESFRERFWNQREQCLFDVVDDNHIPGRVDDTIRPNQIFAVGGLPMPLIEGERAKLIVWRVERDLLTPLGLRTLPVDHPNYSPRYEGGPALRDAVYHQGTVWPWLLGPFVEAWVRVNEMSDDAKRTALMRFANPLVNHLSIGGIGHVAEIADGDSPHMLRGCPFQAWSLGELLRVQALCRTPPSNAHDGVRGRVARRRHEIAV